MHIVHLTASTFFGGPERQMLELANHLPDSVHTSFLLFRENGRYQDFLNYIQNHGFSGQILSLDTPRFLAMIREIQTYVKSTNVDGLMCHGYKANLLGRIAARRSGLPVIAVSRGWTGENWKVRLYEKLDRWLLRRMDRVICVSEGQAEKVRQAKVPESQIRVIRNAARLQAFAHAPFIVKDRLQRYFPNDTEVKQYVLAAGRLSPEKGFPLLVDAAQLICAKHSQARFLLFGDGTQKSALQQQIDRHKLNNKFILAGFTNDLDEFMPQADLVVSTSYTEGLPNVLLEAASAGVAIVATNVSGNSEVVRHQQTGLLVAAGNVQQLADAILQLLTKDALRIQMGQQGRSWMERAFSFEAQANAYLLLWSELISKSNSVQSLSTS